MAQADEGLYQAQARYFKQWLVWGVTLWGHRIPVLLPGGYLLGVVLHRESRRRAHQALPVGVEKTRHPSHARRDRAHARRPALHRSIFASRIAHAFAEGESRNYSEERHRTTNWRSFATSTRGQEEVVAIPEAIHRAGRRTCGTTSCRSRCGSRSYWNNSESGSPRADGGQMRASR